MTERVSMPPEPGPVSTGGVFGWMAQNTVAANLLMACLVVGGLLMIWPNPQIKQEVFPEFELDLVVIQVPYPGASPEEVEQGVILPLEEAVRGVDGIKEVRSTAQEGAGAVTCELLLGTDADRALADVKSAVDRITSFPADVEEPVVSRPELRSEVISLVVYGDASEANLRELASRVRDDLLQEPEITTIELFGVKDLEISVEIAQARLRRFGLTHDDVAEAIRRASVDVPAGGVDTVRGEVLLRTTERRDRGEEFRDIVVRSRPDGSQVTVGDLGTIIDGFADQDISASYEGQRAVMVKVYRVGSQTPLAIAATVKSYIAEHEGELPPGLHFATWNDRSEFYRDRLNLLIKNAALGLTLVLLCLGLFLEIRLAFWVTLGIPISFVGSLLFMPFTGVSINMISLFAFILTLGMVVDDAIVVGEAIYHRKSEGAGSILAASGGVKEVAGPVIFAILTSCIAFSPLLFVPGAFGKFFLQIPVVVILVLLLSLVESLLILPAHLGHKNGSIDAPWYVLTGGVGLLADLLARWPWLVRGQQRFSRLVEWLIQNTYAPTLARALRHRYITMAIGVAILVATVGLVAGGRVEFTFFPKIESDIATATLVMPFGTAVEETEATQQQIYAATDQVLQDLAPDEDVLVGRFALLGAFGLGDTGPGAATNSGGSHIAETAVAFVPSDQRPFTARQFAERWREVIGEVPGVETLSFSFSTGAGGDAPINFELSHPNLDTLEAAAARLAEGLGGYAGVIDIDDGFSIGKEQLDFTLTSEGRVRGITESELARQLRDAYFGAEAVRQQRGRDEIRVYVRRPESERQSLADVEQMVIQTPDGGEIPLLEAASLRRNRSYTEIQRIDGRRRVNVTADVDADTNENQVMTLAQAELVPGLLEDFPSLRVDLGGDQKRQAETLSALGLGFLFALVAMYALMAVAFRSYIQPLIIATAIPFGLVGAVLGHLVMGYDLSLMSMMGVVALSGVVVNDSLILVSAVNEYRKELPTLLESVKAGGTRRFRPIILTSLTTFLGLSPMILETSVGARFLIPMAISLGFGVLFATLITLVLVPCLYLVIEDVVEGWTRLRRMMAGERPTAVPIADQPLHPE
ncbi:MAG: efflux RND transporter permease subunit [Sandaracinaceae bacterium]